MFRIAAVRGSGLPRVNNIDFQIVEIANIACRQCGASCNNNACDFHIPELNGTPFHSSSRGESCRCFCGGQIEWQYPALNTFRQHPRKRPFKLLSLAARCQNLQPKTDFKDSNGCQPQCIQSLAIEPCNNGFIGHRVHDCRRDIRVEHNHFLNVAGRGSSPRISGISNAESTSAKYPASLVPAPSLSAGSTITAWRNISRASSSMLRPRKRARCRSRSFTSSSMFLTIS
jgi:hypothetical protein